MGWTLVCLIAIAGCGGGSGGGTPADQIGVGAECTADNQCLQTDTIVQHCLTEFKGGYCGLKGCTKNADCPFGSLCVTEGATNYCFRECTDKSECNLNRSAANASNCSSSTTLVEPKTGAKVCLPPSG